MKKTIKITIYILAILFIGCTPKKEKIDLPKRTVISGKIQHLEIYPTTKELLAEVIDFRDRKSVFKDSINIDGSFKIELTLYTTQDIKMSPLLDRIIIHPGDSIFIELDFSNISKVNFSGNGAETNRILHKYLWSNAGVISYYTSEKLNIDVYKIYCDKIKAEAIEKQKKFINDEKPPKEFEKWSSDYIKINYYNSILTYPIRYYSRDELGYKKWSDTSHYFDLLNSIGDDFNDFGKTIVNADIYKLLESFEGVLMHKLTKDLPKEKGYTIIDQMELINNNTKNNSFRQMIVGNLYFQHLCANHIEPLYKENIEEIKEPFIKLPLNDFYFTLEQNIKNPKIASDAILSKMGANGKELLDSVIAQNKGKVLFVDLWATWCGPCLEGMKRSRELMPRYKGKNIEFIFICVNSEEKNWKATLSRFGIGGKHYFCNQEQSKDIRRGLGVVEIPHYILINKQGFIIKSNCLDLEKSQNEIEKLLIEK